MVRHTILLSPSHEKTTVGSTDVYFRELKGNLRLFLPLSFLTELEQFRINNSLITTYSLDGHQKAHCCQQCLKAHALRMATEWKLTPALIKYLEIVFPCKAGHDGYYLNQETLIKLP